MLDKHCNIPFERHVSLESTQTTAQLNRIATQSFYPGQYLDKQLFVYRNLRHLECDVSAVHDYLRPDPRFKALLKKIGLTE